MEVKSESEVAQSCPTLSDPVDCSPPGSSIHGIFQARVLEWSAIVDPSKMKWKILSWFLCKVGENRHFWASLGANYGGLCAVLMKNTTGCNASVCAFIHSLNILKTPTKCQELEMAWMRSLL